MSRWPTNSLVKGRFWVMRMLSDDNSPRKKSHKPNLPPAEAADALLQEVRALAVELHPGVPRLCTPALDSSLEEDLGFDSLARAELLMRVERAFAVKLSEKTLATAETPRDLLHAILVGCQTQRGAAGRVAHLGAPEAAELFPDHATTLHEVLDWHVRAHADRVHIVFQSEEGGEQEITYGGLRERAQAVAAGLLRRDLQPGQAVAVMLPTGPDYFFSFFGILLAGGVPVPIYPPARLSQIEDHFHRHAGILSNSRAPILVTAPEAKALAHLLTAQVQTLRGVLTLDDLTEEGAPEGQWTQPRPKPYDIALLQYTSGSTGNPKGVVLSHANLLANLRAMGQALQVTSSDVIVSWLPLYHDMGLIGTWLGSLHFGFPLVVMSPLAFLARPERWLWAIHRHRATLSAAPNFAYELCVRKIDEKDLDGLDLSSWRAALNGAEPVNEGTMTAFTQRFAPYGLRPGAIAPVYGLAECAVGLTFPPLGRGLLVDRIKRDVLLRHARALPATEKDTGVLHYVACGRPLRGHEVRVVDALGRELEERHEGRLQFKGPSATSGYFRNPAQTRALFDGEWLDTGDLAYLAGGDVYITGRTKDIIIRGGRNIHPDELEQAVGNIAGVRRGCVAAFGIPDSAFGTERLVVMAETRETHADERDRLASKINAAVLDVLGMPPDDIVLVPIHSVPKTSSGKIRRTASRELYERGAALSGGPGMWQQIARLAWAGVLPQLRRGLNAASSLFYGAYAWTLFWFIVPLAWLSAVVLPGVAHRWATSRAAMRMLLRLTATPLVTHGLEHLPQRHCVLVANHASYLDGPTLVAALPGAVSFVAKGELRESFLSRVYLKRIGAEFVERFEAEQSVEDVARLVEHLVAGQSLACFPEGTFTRASGLRPFHMGPFVAAARAGVPVVPVTLSGTRSVLRDGSWLPRRGMLGVTIDPPVWPEGTGWGAAIKLRNAVREVLLGRSGEPDLEAA